MGRGGQIASVSGRRARLTPLVAIAGPLGLGNTFVLKGQVLQYDSTQTTLTSVGAGVTVQVSITVVTPGTLDTKNYVATATTDANGNWVVTFNTAASWFQNQIVTSGRVVGVSNGGKGIPGGSDVQPGLYGLARGVQGEVVQNGGTDSMTHLTLKSSFKP